MYTPRSPSEIRKGIKYSKSVVEGGNVDIMSSRYPADKVDRGDFYLNSGTRKLLERAPWREGKLIDFQPSTYFLTPS